MWNRVGKDDFVRARTLKGVYDIRARGWGVCAEYEIDEVLDEFDFRRTPEGWEYVGFTRIVSKYPLSRRDKWRYYDPINETPDLFLTFARLREGDLLPTSILEWVNNYGVLGIDNKSRSLSGYGDPEYTEVLNSATKLASAVLTGYEAVLNDDSDTAKRIIFDHFPAFFVLGSLQSGIYRPREDEHELLSVGKSDTLERIEHIYDGDYIWYLLDRCAEIVQEMVRKFCWPALSVSEKPRHPVRAVAGWEIGNLLGAMYLQMYRLMAAGEEVTSCRYCGRVIALLPLEISDRKVRQDKKYCNDACRQRYHYHNRVKPRRQRQR